MLNRRELLGALVIAGAGRSLSSFATTFPSVRGEDLKQAAIRLPADKAADAASRLGDYGVLSIRSQDRLDRLFDAFKDLGWERPKDFALAEIDWKRSSIVGLLDCGDEGNAFSAGLANWNSLDTYMTYIIYKQRGKVVNVPKVLLIAMSTQDAKVAVKTYHPQNGGPNATKEGAKNEWVGIVGPDTGDSVGGLRGHITPAAKAVKSGEDIRVEFRLELSDAEQSAGQFARRQDKLYVWDGKYSNGYRNHAFHVTKPDGTSAVLRPKVQEEWTKNAPHPEEISAGKPYVLPNWAEGDKAKSLKALGLKTDAPGKYAITGIYTEKGGPATDGPVRRLPLQMWGGELWTNTVVVEVA